MSKKVKVKLVANYGGHSVSTQGVVTLTLNTNYSELVGSIECQQLLNCDIDVKAKLAGRKPFSLGIFRLENTSINHDGCSKIKLKGITEYVETDNINMLPNAKDEDKLFQVLLVSEIEEEE